MPNRESTDVQHDIRQARIGNVAAIHQSRPTSPKCTTVIDFGEPMEQARAPYLGSPTGSSWCLGRMMAVQQGFGRQALDACQITLWPSPHHLGIHPALRKTRDGQLPFNSSRGRGQLEERRALRHGVARILCNMRWSLRHGRGGLQSGHERAALSSPSHPSICQPQLTNTCSGSLTTVC